MQDSLRSALEKTPSSRRRPWDGDAPGPEEARNRLLEVAERCLERVGAESFGIKQVALDAGVGRPTIYRYFKNRDELLNETVIRIGKRRTDAVYEATKSVESVSEIAVVLTIQIIASLRLDSQRGDGADRPDQPGFIGAEFLRFWDDPNMLNQVMEWFAPLIRRTTWTEEESHECTEMIMRLSYSLAATPRHAQQHDLSELRGYLGRRLLPAIGLPPLPELVPAPGEDAPG